MKISRISGFLSILFLLFSFGCKDDNVVENNPGNGNQNPLSPELIEPVNNSISQSNNPTLKWNPYPNSLNYRVQLSTDANFAGTIFADTTLTGTQFTYSSSGLTTNINYYWRVIAGLNGGTFSNWSAVWKFSIILPPPPPPVLISPSNNSINQSFTPIFDWDDSPSAQSYRIQISENSLFNSILFDSSGIGVSNLQCPPMYLNTNSQYFWRVNASNSNGMSTGDWSFVFTFKTLNGPEPNSVSGTITFVDSNFTLFSYYGASAYSQSVWPPSGNSPIKFDSLSVQKIGNIYTAEYKINRLPNGIYYICNGTFNRSAFSGDIFGTFGCDTARIKYSNCAVNPQQVVIENNSGLTGINFKSWADSTKTIF